MLKYYLEFTLNTYSASTEIIKNSLMEFGVDLEIYQLPRDDKEKGENFRINIYTEDPTIIFDICAQFGRLKSVKVSEVTPT